MSTDNILNKYGGRETGFLADASLVGRFAVRWFGGSDSILNCGRVSRIIFLNDYWGQKNNGVFDTHCFSWKLDDIGGYF